MKPSARDSAEKNVGSSLKKEEVPGSEVEFVMCPAHITNNATYFGESLSHAAQAALEKQQPVSHTPYRHVWDPAEGSVLHVCYCGCQFCARMSQETCANYGIKDFTGVCFF